MRSARILFLLASAFLAQSVMGQPPDAGPPGGTTGPVGELQTQLDALTRRVDILSGAPIILDCDSGDFISDALTAGYTQIGFTGTCVGDFDISASGLTLAGTDGDTALNVIEGNITITNATGVELSSFTVDGTGTSGVGFNVVMQDGSYVTLDDVVIDVGRLLAVRSSGANVLNSIISGGTDDQAMEAFRDSAIQIKDTTVTGGAGILAVQFGGNSYFHAEAGSTVSAGAGGSALRIFESSGSRFDADATVVGLVVIDYRSTILAFEDVTFTGSVDLLRGSALIGTDGTITVTGTLECFDDESSIHAVSATTTVNCTGFN